MKEEESVRKITRRQALAGAALGSFVVKPKTAFGTQANSAVAFGIIGTGGRGSYVGSLMAEDENARLAAICDIFPDRIDMAKTKIPGADGVPVYRDYQELLAQPGIDAVLIATPVFLHPEHFEAAANAGKHIYCEKPAGADVAGVKRLMRAAERADKSKSIAFGFQQRFSPEYLAAEEILHDPEQFGNLTIMISYWVWGGNAFAKPDPKTPQPEMSPEERRIRQWGRFKETSGDFIVEQDCHGVDVLNWFSGAHPIRATGAGGRRMRSIGDNTDHANVTYEYPGGLIGWLLGTQLPPRPWWDVKEQFFGTRGVLETERTYYSYMQANNREVRKVKSGREITIDAVEAFFGSIVDGKPLNMAMSSAESTLTAILGRMACELRRPVTWDEMMASA